MIIFVIGIVFMLATTMALSEAMAFVCILLLGAWAISKML